MTIAQYVVEVLQNSVRKPLKMDIRSVCEHNIHGPITRTFLIPRRDLIKMLQQEEYADLLDRIDITEYDNESRLTMYAMSRVENKVAPISRIAEETINWDLDPQYGEYSARASFDF